jgi:hypothetical protein
MYVQRGFGSYGGDVGWWSIYNAEQINAIADWIRARSIYHRLPVTGSSVDLLRNHVRALEDGGGFVVADECFCPANVAGGVSARATATTPCPAGTGGVGGRPTMYLTPAQAKRVSGSVMERSKTIRKDVSKDVDDGIPPVLPGLWGREGMDADANDDIVEKEGEEDGCPEGFVADATGACVEIAPPPPPPTPWYKSPWTWVGIIGGTAAVAGGVYLVVRRKG